MRANLMGIVVGKLTVVRHVGTSQGASVWECVCECGAKVNRINANIRTYQRRGSTASCSKSCPVRVAPTWSRHTEYPQDITGLVFGQLKVLSLLTRENITRRKGRNCSVENHSVWNCECSCGKLVTRTRNGLLRSASMFYESVCSQGCKNREAVKNKVKKNYYIKKADRK